MYRALKLSEDPHPHLVPYTQWVVQQQWFRGCCIDYCHSYWWETLKTTLHSRLYQTCNKKQNLPPADSSELCLGAKTFTTECHQNTVWIHTDRFHYCSNICFIKLEKTQNTHKLNELVTYVSKLLHLTAQWLELKIL